MGIRKYRPITPGTRTRVASDFAEVTGRGRERGLVVAKHQRKGRNNRGVITCRHRGGGHKRLYRVVDFRRNKHGVPAKVAAIHYDPHRNALLALLFYADGEKRYILAPAGLKVGDEIMTSPNANIRPGNCMPLANIPVGTVIHNLEIKIGKGGQLVRSAGTGARLMARTGDWTQIRLPSGEVRRVHARCRATIGSLSNAEHGNLKLGKAGRSRWLGRRPHNRGVVMNPVDHPMGGGEGRTSGGRHPVTPWGKPTKGARTRNNKRTETFIVSRRKR